MYNLRILASDKKKFGFFEQLMSNFRYKKQLLIVFWATFEQPFKKLLENFPWREKATNWKPSTDKRCLTPRHA